ncbi:MAG: D-alanyl-D-alanine carboxypeptidase family protein [Hyphomicrobium sp.]
MRQSKTPAAATMLLLAACASCWPAQAQAGPALLFDAGNGQVLYAEDADNQWHPASLTKIMTAYVVFQAIKAGKVSLDTKIACSESAHAQPPSKVGLPIGAEMSLDLALQALIVKSANDVAVMLAEAVSGNEAAFVAEMNTAARRLGMSRTNFINPNGLPAPDQVTTARDLGKLSRAIAREFPEHAHRWSAPEVRIGNIRLRSHNALLKTFEGADGLKTGFICDSGFNVVASATRDGRRLMAVVLGEPTGHERAVRAASLLEHGFQSYDWKSLFSSVSTLDSMPVPTDAKSVMTVRETVLAWECGTRRRGRAVANAKRLKAKAAQVRAKAKAAKSTAGEAAAPAAPDTPAAKAQGAERDKAQGAERDKPATKSAAMPAASPAASQAIQKPQQTPATKSQ